MVASCAVHSVRPWMAYGEKLTRVKRAFLSVASHSHLACTPTELLILHLLQIHKLQTLPLLSTLVLLISFAFFVSRHSQHHHTTWFVCTLSPTGLLCVLQQWAEIVAGHWLGESKLVRLETMSSICLVTILEDNTQCQANHTMTREQYREMWPMP